MSDPTKSSPLALLQQQQHHNRHLPAVTPSSSAPSALGTSGALVRDYRKGNWTLHETLILIGAKRLDDDRRAAGGGGGGSGNSSAQYSPSSGGGGSGALTPRSSEQRWKWVENYCWHNGCHRSQNQCNDKWDNLLRDYKKVRDYAAAAGGAAGTSASNGGSDEGERLPYWSMERHDRKERNLPTNLASEVFDALTDVLSRRVARRANLSSHPPPPSSPPKLPPPPPLPSPANPSSHDRLLSAPQPAAIPPIQPSVSAEMSASSETEESEGAAEPEAKRRRRRTLGSSVVRSATVLARTLLACEEKRDQRHRQMVELEERRLRLEEERTEIRRQGFDSLISAVNNLSGAINALVAGYRSPSRSR